MINLVKTNSENIDFINLIQKLDKNLHEINGEEQIGRASCRERVSSPV